MLKQVTPETRHPDRNPELVRVILNLSRKGHDGALAQALVRAAEGRRAA